MGLIKSLFGDYSKREIKRIQPLCDKVLGLEETYRAMSEEELRAQTDKLRDRLQMGESTDDILPDAFAVCREAASRRFRDNRDCPIPRFLPVPEPLNCR